MGTGNFSGKLDEMLIILRWSSIPSGGSSDTLSRPVKLRLSAPLESNTDFNNTLRNTDTSNQIFIQIGRRTGQEQTDTTKPMTISEEEELERITSLLQRDNLIRGLGVVEFVYKLLHCTPGTGGPQKNCSLHHSVSYKRNHLKGNVTPLLKEIGKD